MSRLSIEIPDHQHQQIKAMAAMSGLSIKAYIIEKTLPREGDNYSEDELKALQELKEFFAPRIAEIEQGKYSKVTMEELIAEAKAGRNI